MASRGERCPLNASGFRLILQAKNVDQANVFINRMVNDVLGGAITSKKQIRDYTSLITASGMGIRKGWDTILEDLSKKSWVSGGSLPSDVQERLHPTPKEEEKTEEKTEKKPKSSPRMLTGTKLADLQRRLNEGKLETAGAQTTTRKPAAVEKPTPKPAAKKVARTPLEPTPKKAAKESDDVEIMEEPIMCIVTRNQSLFQKRCAALGLNISESTWELLKGSKHQIRKFKPQQACVTVNGNEMWIPDKGVLIKQRQRVLQSKPQPAPTKDLKFQVERTKPAPVVQKQTPTKRAPETKKPSQELEKTVKSLRNEVALLEKQKDLYRTDLEKERVRRKNMEQARAQPARSSGFELVSELDFSNMVKTFPRGPKKMMLVPTTGSFGLAEVHLYVWLQSEDKPTISLSQCGTDMQMAKDLACTIAYKKLSTSGSFRSHFRQTSI